MNVQPTNVPLSMPYKSIKDNDYVKPERGGTRSSRTENQVIKIEQGLGWIHEIFDQRETALYTEKVILRDFNKAYKLKIGSFDELVELSTKAPSKFAPSVHPPVPLTALEPLRKAFAREKKPANDFAHRNRRATEKSIRALKSEVEKETSFHTPADREETLEYLKHKTKTIIRFHHPKKRTPLGPKKCSD